MSYTAIGKYQIIKLLGQGGFGAVYLAEDPTLKTQVAIKVFNIRDPELAKLATSATSEAGQTLRDRFLNEARILRQLASSPNIVDIYEFDQMDDGTPYYVMPFLKQSLVNEIGKDALTIEAIEELDPDLRPHKVTVARTVQVLTQVLSGLKEVHKADLIHRDIKPANILFDDKGNAQLCDFGIAKAPDTQHSQSGIAMGSRNYMSPEQRESAKHVSARSDVFSVGIMAYRMLTGTLPSGRFEDPIVYSPNLGEALNTLILESIENDPRKRPADAAEFLARLKQAEKESAPDDVPADDYTATDMGDAPAAISNELRPLQEKIKSFLLETVTLTVTQRDQLEMSADMLGVDHEQLDSLIQTTESQMESELKPLKNFIVALERQLERNNGKLPADQQEMLLQVGEQNGQRREVLENLIKSKLQDAPKGKKAKAKTKAKPASAVSEPSDQQPKSKGKAVAVGAAALLLVAGAGGYFYSQGDSEPSQAQASSNAEAVESTNTQQSPEVTQATASPKPAQPKVEPATTPAIVQTQPLEPRVQQQPVVASEPAAPVQAVPEPAAPTPEPIATGLLLLTTTPAHASIKLVDTNEMIDHGVRMQVGSYRIEVAAKGYKTKIITADVNPGETKLRVRLTSLVPEGFVKIPSGTFQMGSRQGDADEMPVHSVTLKSFYMQEHEATFAEWDKCVQAGGCRYRPYDEGWGRGNRPLVNVSYNDITQQYIPWLNKTTGLKFRLPTEAEWEYAAKAGRNTKYSWGNSINCSQARFGQFNGACGDARQTRTVKSYQPNAWGLYDMHGNVWEWTADCWKASYHGASATGKAQTRGSCNSRVLRGGSWTSGSVNLRSSERNRTTKADRDAYYGFRLVLEN